MRDLRGDGMGSLVLGDVMSVPYACCRDTRRWMLMCCMYVVYADEKCDKDYLENGHWMAIACLCDNVLAINSSPSCASLEGATDRALR